MTVKACSKSKKRKQCASCPFRKNNDRQFGVIVRKLCEKFGEPFDDLKILTTRFLVTKDARESGKLACHETAYDENMNVTLLRAQPCMGFLADKKRNKR